MSYESERRSPAGYLIGFCTGIAVLSIVNGIVSNNNSNRANDRVREIQQRNEQISDQLKTAHTVGNLLLNDADNTFQFKSRSPEGIDEICTGKYEVQNDAAHVVGNLTCSQTVAVSVR